ncbi:MAG: SCO1 protein [Paracidovorax wautersii]|uniref:SCO1 protein n=1 Tax=Paracidovorax wautersii TaxID=1177982 RepID=A0A7V8FPT1_9BURK|nr:MAG: SCO1 protein [Paracidovorax wautersii]
MHRPTISEQTAIGTESVPFSRRAGLRGMALGLAGIVGAALLAGCKLTKPDFKAVDVTGASYAQGFTLTDASGQRRSLADFKGKLVVVFFGFTQCPDVCPTTLAELAEVKQLLGADGDKLQGVFVSVDPERDTPEILQAYVGNFDPSFVAFRPTLEELAEVAKAYKVYYKKVPGSTPETYTMDHTAGSFIYDTNGRLRLFTRYGSGAQALADDLKILLSES